MSVRYSDVLAGLRQAYDGGAAERDTFDKEPWKVAERAEFEARLRAEGRRRLLEIGAGTGQDSRHFMDAGYEVVAVDLSPEMVARCRAKGVDARVAHFLDLGLPAESVDAVYAMNCLLHVPDADLAEVLDGIRRVLVPGGLCYVGVWGGHHREGVLDTDQHEPKRFFAWRTDEVLLAYARRFFEVEDFHVVPVGEFRFQSLTMRLAGRAAGTGGPGHIPR
ncbi:class I SAM-dependent methyltransferase [Catellatospora vulcania]|uniref:class I SAM-dependent methyltransferase n=1 Tax=Catellatospora vulcania TaxID=1460450 RepID=UPI0012D47CB9|nr:class I SAM-dependent methyltransferase [Catellatospora vulcania]